LDGYAYHPYWGFDKATTRRQARILDAYWQGLPQRSPRRGLRFWWTETGAWSQLGGWPAWTNVDGDPDFQAQRVRIIARRAYRDPLVMASFNYLLLDAPCWKGGLFYEDGGPKPAYYAFRDAIK
jgi:hypothetical protein